MIHGDHSHLSAAMAVSQKQDILLLVGGDEQQEVVGSFGSWGAGGGVYLGMYVGVGVSLWQWQLCSCWKV